MTIIERRNRALLDVDAEVLGGPAAISTGKAASRYLIRELPRNTYTGVESRSDISDAPSRSLQTASGGSTRKALIASRNGVGTRHSGGVQHAAVRHP